MMSERNGRFRLRKYYLDCVGEDGSACVAYAARLHWGPLALSYAALLHRDVAGYRTERHVFGGASSPALGATLAWQCPRLGVRGSWVPDAPGCQRTLLRTAHGHIQWEALAPRARAEVQLAGGQVIRGRGYVERLELTLEPWR